MTLLRATRKVSHKRLAGPDGITSSSLTTSTANTEGRHYHHRALQTSISPSETFDFAIPVQYQPSALTLDSNSSAPGAPKLHRNRKRFPTIDGFDENGESLTASDENSSVLRRERSGKIQDDAEEEEKADES